MLVYKFGGTSVGSVVNINHVKDIIDNNDRKIVVLSAISGTTNALIEISNLIKSNKNEVAIERIKTLNENYNTAVYDLAKVFLTRIDLVKYQFLRYLLV